MNSDLQKFHHNEEPEAKTTRLVGWAVIALIIIAVAGFVVHSGMLSPSPAGASQSYPRGL